MIIYGAGMAGLLAANMLRRHQPVIHEIQPTLPNNHEALLRFRTDAVGRACGILFREVEVTKAIFHRDQLLTQPTIRTNNLYSFKVTDEYRSHSIRDLRPVMRWVAPPDFIQQLATGCQIHYSSKHLETALASGELEQEHAPVISTVPMPTLMRLARWPVKVDFRHKTIWSLQATILHPKADLYQTIYFPDPDVPYYRVSITGNRVIIEFNCSPQEWLCEGMLHEHCNRILTECFGLCNCQLDLPTAFKEQPFGKLLPTDDMERRRFILAMTDEYRIYALGRFATWRQLLMDDVVKDVHIIERWIEERSQYLRRLEQ